MENFVVEDDVIHSDVKENIFKILPGCGLNYDWYVYYDVKY